MLSFREYLNVRLDSLEFECDRKCVPYGYCLSVHLSGDEVGKSLYNSYCFFVEVGVFAASHLDFTYFTGLGYNELYDDTPLDVIFSCHWRILQMALNVFEKFGLATGELGHLLNGSEDFVFFNRLLFLQLRFHPYVHVPHYGHRYLCRSRFDRMQ